MGSQVDQDATPKAVQPAADADFTDRTPYIPRRKSSACERPNSSRQDVSTTSAPQQQPTDLNIWSKKHRSIKKRSRVSSQLHRLSSASLPGENVSTDMYNAVSPPILSFCQRRRQYNHRPLRHLTKHSPSMTDPRSRLPTLKVIDGSSPVS
jgi:hypothetical protein